MSDALKSTFLLKGLLDDLQKEMAGMVTPKQGLDSCQNATILLAKLFDLTTPSGAANVDNVLPSLLSATLFYNSMIGVVIKTLTAQNKINEFEGSDSIN